MMNRCYLAFVLFTLWSSVTFGSPRSSSDSGSDALDGQGPSMQRYRKRSLKKSSKSSSSSSSSADKNDEKSYTGSCLVDEITSRVPEAYISVPHFCKTTVCDDIAVAVVTHGFYEDGMLEPFWEEFLLELEKASNLYGHLCFIMTSIDVDQATERSLSEILSEINLAVAAIENPPQVLFSTDPTTDVTLATTLREISDREGDGPLTGVFQLGYGNLQTEAIISGRALLPFIGSSRSADHYGLLAAQLTKELHAPATNEIAALCLNARPDLAYIGDRCEAYYSAFGNGEPLLFPATGIMCSAKSSVLRLAELLESNGITAVYAHDECCAVAIEASALVGPRDIIVGCMNVEGGDFVVQEPLELQAYHIMSQSNFAAQQADGVFDSAKFPALNSIVETAVYASRRTVQEGQ